MPSLFGTGNVNPKGQYQKLGQLPSDDEFSLSDDEKVLFKKSGEIELNLCPETRRQRAKNKRSSCKYLAVCGAVVVVVVSLVTVAVVFLRTHTVKPFTSNKATEPHTSQVESTDVEHPRSDDGWKVTFQNMAGEGSMRLIDVDGDGIDDVIVTSATAMVKNEFPWDTQENVQPGANGPTMVLNDTTDRFVGLHNRCKSKGQDYPCMGNLIALNGHNGSQIWSVKIRSESFTLNCEDFDVNQDGKKDCIGTGRMGLMVAFDPYIGKILWTCEDDEFFQAYWNTYHAAALPDWNGDGVPEVLIANGGDTSKRPEDHSRDAGRLAALSGATGKPLGTKYLEMPDSKETYMSPVMYTPVDGGATYILFGSGGETVTGDLMGISVQDFCRYILEDKTEVCDQSSASEYPGIEKDENGIFVMYKGKEKGVMVPPVVVDYDGDGVRDILMTTFEGINNLYNGKDLKLIWTANFSGMETYGTPAPGYFDDDGYVDFMVTWNLGVWMMYNSSYVSVISGKDGSVIWSLESAYMQMSSDLSIATSLQNQDVFLFKVQGRDSKFRWTKDGMVRLNSTEARRKRHGENPPPNDLSPVEFNKQQFYRHLNCEDDLTSFKGEVFVIDRRTVKNPIKILDIPTQKHTYDANPKCGDREHGHMVPVMHGEERGQENSMFDQHDDNDDDNDNDQNSEVSHDDDDDDDDGVHDDDDDDEDNGRERPRSSRDVTKRKDELKKKKMCAVETPDFMSSGVIGEVDGDGNLDYISATSTTTMLYDAEYCEQGMIVELTVQKVGLEKGLLDGTFKQLAVNAKTSMEDSGVHIPVQKQKTFLPMSGQKWTQYFGTKDNSVYR